MSIALRGTPQYANSGSATSGATFSITKPTGVVAGDIILVYVALNTAVATPSISGFNAVPLASSTIEVALLTRLADGTEGSTFTVNISSGNSYAAVCVAYQGSAGSLCPYPVTSGTINVTGTVITGAGITTAFPNEELVWFGAVRSTAAGGTPPTITVPGTLTAEGSQSSSSSATVTNMGILMADGVQAAPGATGNVNGTSGSSTFSGGILVGIQSVSNVVTQPVVTPGAVSNLWPLSVASGHPSLSPQNQANIPIVYLQGDAAISSAQAGGSVEFLNSETAANTYASLPQSTVWANSGLNSSLLLLRTNGAQSGPSTFSGLSNLVNTVCQLTVVAYATQNVSISVSLEPFVSNPVPSGPVINSPTVALIAGQPQEIVVSGLIPSGTTVIKSRVTAKSAPPLGTLIYLDDATLTQVGNVAITTNFTQTFPYNFAIPWPLTLQGQAFLPQSVSMPVVSSGSGPVNVTGVTANVNVVANAGQVLPFAPVQQQFPYSFPGPWPLTLHGPIYTPQNPAAIPSVIINGATANVNVVAVAGTVTELIDGTGQVANVNVAAQPGTVYITTNFQQQFPLAIDAPWPLPIIGQARALVPQYPTAIPSVILNGSSANVSVVAQNGTVTELIDGVGQAANVNVVANPGGIFIFAPVIQQFPTALTTPYPLNILTQLKVQNSYIPVAPPAGINLSGVAANVNVAAPNGAVYVYTPFTPPKPINADPANPLSPVGTPYLILQSPANIPGVYVQGDAAVTAVVAGGPLLTFDTFEPGQAPIWGTFPAGQASSTSSAWSHTGNNSLLWQPSGFANASISHSLNATPPAGQGWMASGVLYSPTAITVKWQLQFFTPGGGSQVIAYTNTVNLVAGVPQFVFMSGPAPSASIGVVKAVAQVSGTPPAGTQIYIDDVVLSPMPSLFIGTNFTQQIPFSNQIYPLNLAGANLIPQNPANIPSVIINGSTANVNVATPAGTVTELVDGVGAVANVNVAAPAGSVVFTIPPSITAQPIPFGRNTPYPLNIISRLQVQIPSFIQNISEPGPTATVSVVANAGVPVTIVPSRTWPQQLNPVINYLLPGLTHLNPAIAPEVPILEAGPAANVTVAAPASLSVSILGIPANATVAVQLSSPNIAVTGTVANVNAASTGTTNDAIPGSVATITVAAANGTTVVSPVNINWPMVFAIAYPGQFTPVTISGAVATVSTSPVAGAVNLYVIIPSATVIAQAYAFEVGSLVIEATLDMEWGGTMGSADTIAATLNQNNNFGVTLVRPTGGSVSLGWSAELIDND